MGWFSNLFGEKPLREDPELDAEGRKMLRRVRSLRDDELRSWADTAVSETGRQVTLYFRNGEIEHLDEAELNAQSLLALVRQLRIRADEQGPNPFYE